MTYFNSSTQLNSNFFNCTTGSVQDFGVYNNSVFGNGFMCGFGMPTSNPVSFMPSFTSWFNPASFTQSFQSFNFSNKFSNFNFSNSFANFGNFDFSKSFFGNMFAYNSTATTSSSAASTSTQTYKIGNFDLNYWKSKGYDHEKGKALALDAAKVKRGTPGQCVGYTRKTINRVYGTNFTNAGKAENFGTTILSQPELKGKFRLATKEEIEKGGIPDGAVVLWKGGSPGFTKGKAASCGHGGICYQNAVYSNYVETKRLGTAFQIWIPVTSA